jgi:hypothetical protein
MRYTLDPTVAISKTELLQLLADMQGELSCQRGAEDEPSELEDRCASMQVRLGSAGVFGWSAKGQ